MLISVICPIFNEEKFIKDIIEFFLNSEPADKELILIDGGSTDNTIHIINEYLKKYNNIKLLNNKNKYVPYALNMAIKECKGEIIVRLDAHCKFDKSYFVQILEAFKNNDADIVGGPCNTGAHNYYQKAVGFAINSKFGTGNSLNHNLKYEGYTDSVVFGAFKKDVFNDVGLFDIRLIRNQDDEFNYRAKSKGKKLFLTPKIKFEYYPRSDVKSLIKQYFQYGYYKPLVLKKVKSEIKLRHLIPSLFSLYFLLIPLTLVSKIYLIPFLLYILMDLIISIINKEKIVVKLALPIIFPSIHLSYGIGFLIGLFKLKSISKK